jgi:glycosyltransferase involved in cell wall biosynthesis
VIVITHQLPKTREEERINGVRIVRIPCMDSRYLFTFAAIPAVLRHAKDADIIHTTTYNGAFPAWLGAVVRGKPKLITIHETWLGKWREYTSFSRPKAWLHEFLEWCVYHIPRFDRYVCVSHSTHQLLRQALPRRAMRMLTVHNGFAPPKAAPHAGVAALRRAIALDGFDLGGKFVIFASGRPGTSKGFEYLVDAFPFIAKKMPDAVLLLMLSTDAQYRHRIDDFRKMIAERGLADRVRFLPPQPYAKLATYRQISDCIVVPSVTEGFGYAVLEACAAGVPVVATQTTSIPEVIYGKHLLVKPKSAKAIAEGIARVRAGKYQDTPLRSFPWTKTIAGYERVYRDLLSEGR